MTAKYVLFMGSDGQFYFTLYATNSEAILQSEGYRAKGGALNGIDSCRRHSPYDRYYDRVGYGAGCWFRLKAANGEIIGRSETYSSSTARDAGIASVKLNAPTAILDDRTQRAA